mgnify:CR=1 FL=1
MSVRKGQERLKNIAGQISDDKQLSSEDKEFLVKALIEISDGEDAETALAVKFKKGERKSRQTRPPWYTNWAIRKSRDAADVQLVVR